MRTGTARRSWTADRKGGSSITRRSGLEFGLVAHEDEASACADLLAQVVREEHSFFDLVAGPAPAREADEAFDAWLQQRGIAHREDLAPTEWKYDDVPWTDGPYWRRYFVRITTIRRLG